MKKFKRTAAALVACGALLLTGCQSDTVDLDRAIQVTSLPTPQDPEPRRSPGPTAGLDLHIGSATFRIDCAADSLRQNTHGTAALMCTWDTRPR